MNTKSDNAIGKSVKLENPINITLNFSEYTHLETKSQEIRGSLLTGKHGVQHSIRPANIVLCRIHNFESDGGLFEYVDFKDSFVQHSKFSGCSFNFGTIINCDFDVVRFEGAEFRNVSITNSKFQSCVFYRCNLDHMVIESCRFIDCQFIECSTSNKLFDYCFLADCQFEKMELQVQTIINCFGITKRNLIGCSIRDKSTDEEYELIDYDQINSFQVISHLEQFKLDYFVDPSCLVTGSDSFDRTFEIGSWVGTAKIPLTFTNLISMYSEFLFDQYEKNNLYTFPFIRLHTLTNLLIESGALDRAAMIVVQGVHMALSEVVELYVSAVYKMSKSAEQPLLLLVNGPLEKDYYYNEFEFLFDRNCLTIGYIKKHNSPNELALAWSTATDLLPVIAIFLATRFRLEFNTRTEALPGQDGSSAKTKKDISPTNQKFLMHFGFDNENEHLYGMKLRSIFPGNLVGELGLQISTKQIHAARNLLVRMLSSREKT